MAPASRTGEESPSKERCGAGTRPGAWAVWFGASKRQQDPAETEGWSTGGGTASHIPQSRCVEGRIGQCLMLAPSGAAFAATRRASVRKPINRRATAFLLWSPEENPESTEFAPARL